MQAMSSGFDGQAHQWHGAGRARLQQPTGTYERRGVLSRGSQLDYSIDAKLNTTGIWITP